MSHYSLHKLLGKGLDEDYISAFSGKGLKHKAPLKDIEREYIPAIKTPNAKAGEPRLGDQQAPAGFVSTYSQGDLNEYHPPPKPTNVNTDTTELKYAQRLKRNPAQRDKPAYEKQYKLAYPQGVVYF